MSLMNDQTKFEKTVEFYISSSQMLADAGENLSREYTSFLNRLKLAKSSKVENHDIEDIIGSVEKQVEAMDKFSSLLRAYTMSFDMLLKSFNATQDIATAQAIKAAPKYTHQSQSFHAESVTTRGPKIRKIHRPRASVIEQNKESTSSKEAIVENIEELDANEANQNVCDKSVTTKSSSFGSIPSYEVKVRKRVVTSPSIAETEYTVEDTAEVTRNTEPMDKGTNVGRFGEVQIKAISKWLRDVPIMPRNKLPK